ncbi:NnrU family protein [Rhizobium mayense]|uniref:NnrU family protein n=1 Tax=Rhizobium mayense TaxID=1312184 RepID=A0ABT7K5H7_9HYPH|nr:NnrU family protein [Rhizobium mayense]MDL2403874.1 NnrU family protein [Rhizobium mayense]
MTEFALAFALFLVLHSVPAIPAIRSAIIARTGRPAYFILYSTVSTAVLIWVFRAALALDYIPLWDFQPWHAAITILLAPIGIFLVVAGLLSCNPLSVSLRTSGRPGAIVFLTRHPVLWGFAFWAVGHLVANGDLRAFLLFGGFALFSLGSIPMAEKRARKRLGTSWAEVAASTSIFPFAGVLRRHGLGIDVPILAGALAAAIITGWLLLGGHSFLFGADPIATWM